jgi:phosphoribosyl-AMP cyclohydrolase
MIGVYERSHRCPASSSSSCPQATGGALIPGLNLEKIGKEARRQKAGFFIAHNMNLDFTKAGGLITAVIQDYATGRVLMVGYMNEEAFKRTVESGYATFYSRSRQKIWLKGETSGHRMVVKEISTDCDRDAVLVQVEALGPGVCHKGYQSCFFRRLENREWRVSEERTFDPGSVYGGHS